MIGPGPLRGGAERPREVRIEQSGRLRLVARELVPVLVDRDLNPEEWPQPPRSLSRRGRRGLTVPCSVPRRPAETHGATVERP
jgi:hypothetical protein